MASGRMLFKYTREIVLSPKLLYKCIPGDSSQEATCNLKVITTAEKDDRSDPRNLHVKSKLNCVSTILEMEAGGQELQC